MGVGAKCWTLRNPVWADKKPLPYDGQPHLKKCPESRYVWLRLLSLLAHLRLCPETRRAGGPETWNLCWSESEKPALTGAVLAAGLRNARAKGKRLGRPRCDVEAQTVRAAVDTHGSVAAAALSLGISYGKTWQLNHAERRILS